MAFRQHARPPRPLSFSNPAPPILTQELAESSTTAQRKHTLDDDPEEWVLFSPTAAAPSTTTSTSRTPRTNGLSHLSDFGSLETAARSDQQGDDDDDDDDLLASASLNGAAAADMRNAVHADDDNLTAHGDDDEAGDLDSLDDGLHAFHEPSEHGGSLALLMLQQSATDTVLPSHDGLGMFPASSSVLQEQLWQFETRPAAHGWRRLHGRRRSSVQRTLDALQEGMEPLSEEHERMLRIEKWRLEQSKALLEEIERETKRRRRRSVMSAARSQAGTESAAMRQQRSSVATSVVQAPAQEAEETSGDEEGEGLSFLQRFTQRVIRDLMGIDENILSVIFGEALPEEVGLSTTPKPSAPMPSEEFKEILESADGGSFTTHRILERIARELGIIVHRLSEHPGAFETYLRTKEPIPYAGLSATVPNTLSSSETLSSPTVEGIHSSINPQSANIFNPTLESQQPHTAPYSEASLWGIEEEPDPLEQTARPQNISDPQRLQQEREYWERDLDAKMVFRFLLRRFRSRSASPSSDDDDEHLRSTRSPLYSYSSHAGAGVSTTTARRAALIRQNHPLVAHNHHRSSVLAAAAAAGTTSRRHELLHRHHHHHHHGHGHMAVPRAASSRGAVPGVASAAAGGVVVTVAETRRPGSSCASQSTKRSRKSGSSRNYWDLGGSVGSWGEV